MDLAIIFVFLATFLLAYLFLSKPRNLPPGPVTLPLLGSVTALRQLSKDSAYAVFFEYAKRYGNIMSLRVGSQLIVVLSGFETIHEALVKRAEVFSDRARIGVLLRKFKGIGIVRTDYNQHWRVLRRFTLQSLRDFGVGKTSLEDKIAIEIDTVEKYLRQSEGKPLVIKSLFQKLVANVIYGIIFAIRFDYQDPKFDKARNISTIIFRSPGLFSANNFLPTFIVKFFSKEDVEALEERVTSLGELQTFVYEMIDEHEATFDNDNIRDFIDFYIKTAREENPDEQNILTKENIFRVILELFLAGSETTFNTMDWAFLLLAEFPDVQKKCLEEIGQVIGERQVMYSDRGNLPYVEATIMEIMRIASTAPLTVPHYVKTDTEFGGYCIPANTMVMPNLWSVSMDEALWPEPTQLDPTRFIDESGKLKKGEKNIPFSVGPRVCLGEPLARMELFLVVTNLLQRFRFERESPDVRHSLESVPRQITRSPLPYKLRVFER